MRHMFEGLEMLHSEASKNPQLISTKPPLPSRGPGEAGGTESLSFDLSGTSKKTEGELTKWNGVTA